MLVLLSSLWVSTAVSQDWGKVATVSGTMGINANRLCVGEASRGDFGCPTYGPSLTTAGDVNVVGSVTAASFSGDGSGLFNIGGASADRIVSGTTSMLAISNTGYVSLTQSGVNTGWFDPARGLVTIGVSSTGAISGTNIFSSGGLGAGAAPPPSLGANAVYALGAIRSLDYMQAGGGLRLGDANHIINASTTNKYMSFTVSGTETVRIVSTGYVGIGTSTPTQRLDVNGTARIVALAISGAGYLTSSNTTSVAMTTNSGYFFQNGTGNTVFMSITSSSRVGIGIVSPTAELDVSGSVRVSGTLALVNTGNEPCDAAHHYSFRINPSTGVPQMCRP